ncbi:VPA1267 family protein [Marinobacter salarius]
MSIETNKNLNGVQKAQISYVSFRDWVRERKAAGDWDRYLSSSMDKLNRSEIAAECGFARSALGSNPRLKRFLRRVEKVLRKRGILKPVEKIDANSVKAESDSKDRTLGRTRSRVKTLEQQLAAVTVERDDLRRRLDRLEFLEYNMAKTGRVPH